MAVERHRRGAAALGWAVGAGAVVGVGGGREVEGGGVGATGDGADERICEQDRRAGAVADAASVVGAYAVVLAVENAVHVGIHFFKNAEQGEQVCNGDGIIAVRIGVPAAVGRSVGLAHSRGRKGPERHEERQEQAQRRAKHGVQFGLPKLTEPRRPPLSTYPHY